MNTEIQIERWQIDRLIPRANNPRTHNREQVANIAASIREWGWTNPILVDGDNGILAGHARLAAARKLGMEEVPVIVLRHLCPAQRRALVIADNQLAIAGAGRDEEMLRIELAILHEEDFNLDLVGFEDVELARLLNEQDAAAGLTDEDAVPEVQQNPVAKTGDLFILGNHRLTCGDCTDPAVVARLLCDARPGLMITDPPYGIELDSEWRDRAGLNGCGPAEASYMKHRTEGHTETTISGDTRADWSEAFALRRTCRSATSGMRPSSPVKFSAGCCGSASSIVSRSSGTRGGRSSRVRSIGSNMSPVGLSERRTPRGSAKRERTRRSGIHPHRSSSWAARTKKSSIIPPRSRWS
jgi:hypothetical protein